MFRNGYYDDDEEDVVNPYYTPIYNPPPEPWHPFGSRDEDENSA